MSDTTDSSQYIDGFHLVIEALKLNGLATIYGVAGIPITDLARLATSEGIRYIGFRHEQSAGNAAAISGYLTQKPGICLTVSAPGFLNGMVALANATTNGFPMIQISGSSNRAIIDLQQGDYEELDQLNAAKPYVKAAYRVNHPKDIGIGVARAIRAALSGRPGGVYLDLTAEVLSTTIDKEEGLHSLIKVVDPVPEMIPGDMAIQRALAILKTAKRPLIILGKGAAYAQADDAIKTLVEQTGIPFLPMSMAKGLLPDTHQQSAATSRSLVLGQADVILLIGARLNWLLEHGQTPKWSAEGKIIQIDIEPTEMDSNRAIAAPVVGDIKSSITALLAQLAKKPYRVPVDWCTTINQHKKHNAEKMAQKLAVKPEPMNFLCAMNTINDIYSTYDDVYLIGEGANTLDVGRNIINMNKPRMRFDTGTWGVMGIGMGYTIGAAVTTGKRILAVVGDSAFGFSGMEVETICRYQLPAVIVIFNNGGIYRGDDVSGVTQLAPHAHYEKLIEAFGGIGYFVNTYDELAKALKTALDARQPAIINCVIDPKVGTESGHLSNLNPTSQLKK